MFRALRHIPALLEIARDMQELCPKAILFNYANPMAMCCWALGRVPGLQFIGLCHGVQTTMDLIASYVGVPKEEIDFLAAGINHMAWFLKLEHDGKDLYPTLEGELREARAITSTRKSARETMRHFGYFMTESTGHLSEYLPYFRKSEKALELYCDEPAFGGETGAYYKYCAMLDEKLPEARSAVHRVDEAGAAQRRVLLPHHRGQGDGSPFPAQRQCPQRRLSSPTCRNGCCVEVPIYVDRNGLHPTRVGDLPVQLAALNMTNVLVQGLPWMPRSRATRELLACRPSRWIR